MNPVELDIRAQRLRDRPYDSQCSDPERSTWSVLRARAAGKKPTIMEPTMGRIMEPQVIAWRMDSAESKEDDRERSQRSVMIMVMLLKTHDNPVSSDRFYGFEFPTLLY